MFILLISGMGVGLCFPRGTGAGPGAPPPSSMWLTEDGSSWLTEDGGFWLLD